jgi:hypothetical protein
MPIPMPPNMSRRSAAADAPAAPRSDFPTPQRRAGPCLTAAVAAIVAVAAQRARGAGTLDALREAVAMALDTGERPPPSRATPEATSDEARLRALFGRVKPL